MCLGQLPTARARRDASLSQGAGRGGAWRARLVIGRALRARLVIGRAGRARPPARGWRPGKDGAEIRAGLRGARSRPPLPVPGCPLEPPPWGRARETAQGELRLRAPAPWQSARGVFLRRGRAGSRGARSAPCWRTLPKPFVVTEETPGTYPGLSRWPCRLALDSAVSAPARLHTFWSNLRKRNLRELLGRGARRGAVGWVGPESRCLRPQAPWLDPGRPHC